MGWALLFEDLAPSSIQTWWFPIIPAGDNNHHCCSFIGPELFLCNQNAYKYSCILSISYDNSCRVVRKATSTTAFHLVHHKQAFCNLIKTPQSPQQCIIGDIIPPSITFLSISPTDNDKKELGAVKMLILWYEIFTLLLARHQQHYHCWVIHVHSVVCRHAWEQESYKHAQAPPKSVHTLQILLVHTWLQTIYHSIEKLFFRKKDDQQQRKWKLPHLWEAWS